MRDAEALAQGTQPELMARVNEIEVLLVDAWVVFQLMGLHWLPAGFEKTDGGVN